MKILIIDEKKTRREELASINKDVNNILKNCDQLHIPDRERMYFFY